jgi:diacylglycerol kinase family enzyme
MDVGEVNGHYFFGNMGCALESHFIRTYQKNKWHGIWAYIIAFLDAILSFRYQKIKIEYDENSQTISPFVMLVSNTNQQGYDFSLTPQALSNDGLMDVFWMEKSNFFNNFIFIVNALMGRKLTTKGCNLIRLSALKISLLESSDLCVQIDGEFLPVASKRLEIKVLPKQLNLIVP